MQRLVKTTQDNVNSLKPYVICLTIKVPLKHEVNIKVVFINGNTNACDTYLVYLSVLFTVSQRSVSVLLKGSSYTELEPPTSLWQQAKMSPSGHSHDHSGHSHGEMNEHSNMASHETTSQMNHNMEGGHAVRELSGLLASD